MIDGFLHMRKGSETKNEVNHDKWSGSRIEIMWQCNMGKSYWIWQRLVLHVTHCHTWCVSICRGILNLIPPIVLIERKLSTKEACVHKKVSKWNVVLVEMKNFSPTSKLKTRVNWKCSEHPLSQWTFFCKLQRSSISQNSFSYGPFWKAPIPT